MVERARTRVPVQVLMPVEQQSTSEFRAWSKTRCVGLSEVKLNTPWIRDYGPLQVFDGSAVTWLDFGCGAGGLLKYLRDLGELECHDVRVPVHPVGHDVGSYSERLKHDDDFEILSWEQLDRDCVARFDIISCIEVIEHIPYPRAVIELLARSLKPDGLLILTTGNLDCPLAKLQGINFTYCIPEIHVSLFNPSLLSRLYREVGLTPVLMRHDETIKFRFLKNLALIPFGKLLAWLAFFAPARRFADYLFGVSRMPFAIKAVASTPSK
jgi:SAM-dependent methyltransferase